MEDEKRSSHEEQDLRAGDFEEGTAADNIIHVNSKNSPIQSGGSQNNYFIQTESYREEEQREFFINFEELNRLEKIYVPHEVESEQRSMTANKRIVFGYGKRNSGRFSFGQNFLRSRGYDKISCFSRIEAKDITKIKWKASIGYLLRNVDNIESVLDYYPEILARVSEHDCCLLILMDEEQFFKLEGKYYDSSIHIKFPMNKKQIVKNHVTDILESNSWLSESGNTTAKLETQLNHPWIIEEIEKTLRMDDLVKLSMMLSIGMHHSKGTPDERGLQELFDKLHNQERWISLVNGITNIQEKLFLLSLCCLNGFTKERILSKYRKLEMLIEPLCSSDEREQIQKNEFWTLSWTQRLKKAYAVFVDIENPYADYSQEFITAVQISDLKTVTKIVGYYMQEYDWFDCVRDWLIHCAYEYQGKHDWKELRELNIFIKGLGVLSRTNFNEVFKTLKSNCEEDMYHTTKLYVFAGFLREFYDSSNEEGQKFILGTLREWLAGNSRKMSYIGIRVCDFKFFDLCFKGLIDKVISVSFRFPELSEPAAHFILSAVNYLEESNIKGIFEHLLDYRKLWEEGCSLVVSLFSFLSPQLRLKWNSKTQKVERYPLLLYIFGKNPYVRKSICDFIKESMLHYPADMAAMEYLKKLYKVVRKYPHNTILKEIYRDFSRRIKDSGAYCFDMITGMEQEYENIMKKV